MLRKIIVGFFTLFVFLGQPALAAAPARGALFTATWHGHTLHLFGTMHVGRPEFYPLEPRILNAVAQAKVLALEIDLAADPAGNAAIMQQAMLAPTGTDPYASLNPESRARLEKALSAAGLPLAAVKSMRPWALAVMLSMREYEEAGYQSMLASDLYLANYARAKKVPVVQLESVATQLNLFSSLSNAEQLRFLEEGLEQAANGKQTQDLQDIVQAWSQADRARIEDLAARAAADTSFAGTFTQKVLLEGRNGPLADKIAALLDKEPRVVVAIGMLHLAGAHSVVDALKAKGIKLERVY